MKSKKWEIFPNDKNLMGLYFGKLKPRKAQLITHTDENCCRRSSDGEVSGARANRCRKSHLAQERAAGESLENGRGSGIGTHVKARVVSAETKEAGHCSR